MVVAWAEDCFVPRYETTTKTTNGTRADHDQQQGIIGVGGFPLETFASAKPRRMERSLSHVGERETVDAGYCVYVPMMPSNLAAMNAMPVVGVASRNHSNVGQFLPVQTSPTNHRGADACFQRRGGNPPNPAADAQSGIV